MSSFKHVQSHISSATLYFSHVIRIFNRIQVMWSTFHISMLWLDCLFRFQSRNWNGFSHFSQSSYLVTWLKCLLIFQ